MSCMISVHLANIPILAPWAGPIRSSAWASAPALPPNLRPAYIATSTPPTAPIPPSTPTLPPPVHSAPMPTPVSAPANPKEALVLNHKGPKGNGRYIVIPPP